MEKKNLRKEGEIIKLSIKWRRRKLTIKEEQQPRSWVSLRGRGGEFWWCKQRAKFIRNVFEFNI